MTLQELKNLFKKELENIYTLSESLELFYIFSEKFLELSKLDLQKIPKKEISREKVKLFSSAITELKTGKPYQQILGEAFFYRNRFFIDENVLIPRPETEELVDLIIKKLCHNSTSLKILDIGTGSGCIPITLAKSLPNSQITSIDISPKALNIARKNADFYKVKINFVLKDYLNELLDDVYDIIVSNPPYIGASEEEEIPLSVKNFEPKIALFAPPESVLAFYEKIAEDCKNHLSEKGMIFLEINQKLGQQTLNLFKKILSKSKILKDLSGNERFIIGNK